MARFLITGASRGIGRSLVERLAADHDLIALGRSEESLADLPVSSRVVADLEHPAELAKAIPHLDSLDGLVHCAGVAQRGDLSHAAVEEWESHFRLNATAPAELTRLLLPALRASRGTVVFVNSGQGLTARANSTVYAASKHALRAIADSVRAEEPLIRVASLFPGRVATEMQRALRAQEGVAYEPEHYLKPETVAAAIAHILATPPDAVVTDMTIVPANP